MPRIKSEIQFEDKANYVYPYCAKKELKDTVLLHLGMFAVLFGLLVMHVVIAYTQEWTDFSYVLFSIAVPFLSIAIVVQAFKFIRNFSILRALNRIRSESAETVKIECKDVRFIAYYHSRMVTSLMIAIIFVGTNHKKYLYVLPESLFNYKKIRQHIIDICLFETVEFTCYKGTKMIKHFDIWDRYR